MSSTPAGPTLRVLRFSSMQSYHRLVSQEHSMKIAETRTDIQATKKELSTIASMEMIGTFSQHIMLFLTFESHGD